MANAAYERALEIVRALAPEERQRLVEELGAERRQATNGEMKLAYPREREMNWLSRHEEEYAGQWLALAGDRLVGHGTDPHKVFAEARAQGVADPFMVFAESNEPAMGGWA